MSIIFACHILLPFFVRTYESIQIELQGSTGLLYFITLYIDTVLFCVIIVDYFKVILKKERKEA
jgi:type II secretory pathway component PulF